MRVGFDARWYGGSGVGNYVAELLQALAAIPGDFELIAYEDQSNPLPDIPASKFRKVSVQAPRYSVAEQVELPRCCKRDRLDVFHAPFYVVPLLAPCPVVVTIHDVIPFLFHIYGRAKELMIRTGYRFALYKASRVLADSQKTADDLVGLFGFSRQRITVAPLAASPRWFHPDGSAQELSRLQEKYGVRRPFVMFNSARHWRSKNLSGALRALQQCAANHVDFQAVVAGSPDGIEQALREVETSGFQLVRTGFVPTEDLAALYRQAQAYLLTSRYEGFGLPLLEAMACGCAVVTSNAGSLLEVAGDDVLTFAPDDWKAMGDTLARLLTNSDFRQAQRLVSLQRATAYSWKQTAERTLGVYNEAVQGTLAGTS